VLFKTPELLKVPLVQSNGTFVFQELLWLPN